MNYIDLIIIAALVYAIYHGFQRGFVIGVLSLLSTIISFSLSLALFSPIAGGITNLFHLKLPILPLIIFLFLLIVFESVGSVIIGIVDSAILQPIYKVKLLKWSDQILGIIPSLVLAFGLIGLLLLIPILIPLSAMIRGDVQSSFFGKAMLPQLYSYMPKVEQLAHTLPTQGLLYLIPQSPSSDETVAMNFPQSMTLSVDEASEQRMLALINQERIAAGFAPLTLRQEVVPVARAHSKDMFVRSYFSHINPDGKSPFDRLSATGITYLAAGENLAYAPDVEIAHKGLMNSPGHRENILRPEFKQVGIGVIDGGIYGKMFTQNFTD